MEIRKLECPSCGAPHEWNSTSCGFCKTELRFFEDEGAALPVNLIAADIESIIILHEKDFWKATIQATAAPYSIFKKLKHYNELNFKNDFWPTHKQHLQIIYDSFFIFPSENYVAGIELGDGYSCILTSLRLFLFRGTNINVIPLEDFISWTPQLYEGGKSAIGIDGRNYLQYTVLKYLKGNLETKIQFKSGVKYISESIIDSVRDSKEWEDLNPMQKNLLNLSRYKVNKSFKIQVKPLELMDFVQPKKACFVATATMGDYNHPVVVQLRDFRDSYLIKKTWGLSFINWYYSNGPFLAKIIERNYFLKKLSYWFIIRPLCFITKYLK